MPINKHFVYAVWQKFFGILRSSVSSYHDRIDLVAHFFCQLSCFPDQLKNHRMHLAALLLRIDQDAIPGTLVLSASLLLKIKCLALALSHTDTTHPAVFI